MKKQLVFLCLFLFSMSVAYAQESNTINILTVSELNNGTYQGGVASLDLVIQEGTGSIFIESFPLSNVDTQAVTRIATDIACSYSSANCDSLDFFYTITTNSGFVRGPSAGGATALLALATLEGAHLDKVAMTGGISSGGLITSVGGVQEKSLAAVAENFPLIIIPALSLNVTYNETNVTPLLLDDFQTAEKSIHPIYSLDEAYFLATEERIPSKTLTEPPAFYTQRMKETASQLCARTQELFDDLESKSLNTSLLAQDYFNKSLVAQRDGDYYSSASFCYSANIRLREELVEELDDTLRLENYNRLEKSIENFELQTDSYDLETFSDLEAYIIVKERLFEAQEYLDAINSTNISSSLLALGIERYYSAVAWSGFFGIPGEPLVIDESSLELACIRELREVEARSNYLKTTLPLPLLVDIISQLDGAYEQYNSNNYPLCIFKASKAKASAHMFMNEIQVESQLMDISIVKLHRVEELIARQQAQGAFPIIGYSYYEYSQQLAQDQPYVSLLFAEYAISMADVSKYFPKAKDSFVGKTISVELFYLILGFLFGVIVMRILHENKSISLTKGQMRSVKKKQSRNKRSKK